MKVYDTIVAGAGAAGLYCGCKLDTQRRQSIMILEKKKRPGLKLLMAGGGQCNVTHGGSIKDFLNHYGEHGRLLRGVLQRHNNIELCRFFENLGVELREREDGKIFPRSLDGHDVLKALEAEIFANSIEIKFDAEVQKISAVKGDSRRRFAVYSKAGEFACANLVIATGGCSYPSTGSDGSMLQILGEDLGMAIVNPAPALTSVALQDYKYGGLRGISFDDVEVTISSEKEADGCRRLCGDLLFTERTLSGPVILNGSRYMKPADRLTINYLYPTTASEVAAKCKSDFAGNGKSPQSYMSDELGLPKRFARIIAEKYGIEERKVSQLSGKEIEMLSDALTRDSFTIKRLSGFNEAMVTAGGVDLEEMDLRRMRSKKYDGLYIIGEALDIDGDTGGYNLQFAYSSAAAAADDINRE